MLYQPCIAKPVRISSDGLIRLSVQELHSIAMRPLISGLDVETCTRVNACGKVTSISGYTEWVGVTNPIISIGWDWCIKSPPTRAPSWERISLPCANIMVLNKEGRDMRWAENLRVLAGVVDALPWRESVAQAVTSRYS